MNPFSEKLKFYVLCSLNEFLFKILIYLKVVSICVFNHKNAVNKSREGRSTNGSQVIERFNGALKE